MDFSKHLRQSENKEAKILLKHSLWGEQVFQVEALKIIDTEDKLGVAIKGNDIYMYKKDVRFAKTYGNMLTMFDGRLTIIIIVNKM